MGDFDNMRFTEPAMKKQRVKGPAVAAVDMKGVGSASALVTFICVFCTNAYTQISRLICDFTLCRRRTAT
jgi:hypothetical protein